MSHIPSSVIFSICILFSAGVLAIDSNAPYHEQIIQGLTEHPTRDRVIPWEPQVGDRHELMFNREAPVPPQCYTKNGGRHNPCYVCHQDQNPAPFQATIENTMNDRDLQEAYSFSDAGLTNHWANLFEDRSARVAAITDQEILDWIDDDNYSGLASRLEAAGYGDDNWSWQAAPDYRDPWMPDLDNLQERAAAFDGNGLALDGSWWVAFNYKPLPSTFWPHNGSTDDVMIRLPPEFWKLPGGEDSVDLYRANLALVEANVKSLTTISSLPINEQTIGIDVDNDGVLNTRVTRVHIETNRRDHPVNGPTNYYLGQAGDDVNADAKWSMRPTIYPVGTEFLHSVRYVGVDEDGNISVARRMKELRYMRRVRASYYGQIWSEYQAEQFDKEEGLLPRFGDHEHNGLAKGSFGWEVVGFIEDWEGKLRLNTFEENAFCMGCHGVLGSTIDKTFSFPRKVDGAAGWGYINLRGMQDVPNMGDTQTEIEAYMTRVGGGSEFRSNPELEAKYYLADGETLNRVALASARDVYDLVTPSRERALMLNKAYKVITEDQDYIFGRDATVSAPPRVYDAVTNDTPSLAPENQFDWDIRLDWSQAPAEGECMYRGDASFADLPTGYTLEVGGVLPHQHDQVCAGGRIILAGALTIELAAGYSPQAGDRVEIIRAGSLLGDFSNVTLPDIPGLVLDTGKVGNSVFLNVASSSAICGDSSCEVGETPANCAQDCEDACGDGLCTGAELSSTCPADCGPECGDERCDAGEDPLNCPQDCDDQCGDGICGETEDVVNCSADCPDACGDGLCTGYENASSCSADCPDSCGDGFCTGNESAASCAGDCPPSCGDGLCSASEDAGSCPGDCPHACGDSIVGGGEDCETGVALADSCMSLGFTGGSLGCNAASCSYDTSACTEGSCAGNKQSCTTGSDCCSGNCKQGRCRGN